MSVLKDYKPPRISVVMLDAEDVITESLPFYPGQGEGELPFQPFHFSSTVIIDEFN